MDESINLNVMDHTPMKDFYRDKVIFLTGATGVLGELFVEKLLRCQVKRIYILMRLKKQNTIAERLKETFTTAIFSPLAVIDPNYLDRIHVISGNVNNLGLGISDDDVAVLHENVEIALHVAANVRFDCPLEEIGLVNVRGTREMLKLAEGFKKLISFIYMSTAYCHSHKENMCSKEKFYDTPWDPDEMIRVCEYFENSDSTDVLSFVTQKLIDPWPNTYSFSKAVTEELIRRASKYLPIAVVRPSIVIATCEDPIPGYCTNYFGLNGVLAACGAGLARIILGDTRNRSNVVCADFVINSTLAVIWDMVEKKNNADPIDSSETTPRIYIINNYQQDLTWGLVSDTMGQAYAKAPWQSTIWLPRTNYTMCPFMEFWLIILYQYIPGIIFDSYLWVTNSKKRILPIYRKIILFMLIIKYFMSNQWSFENNNIKDVYDRMDERDRKFFPVDVGSFSWQKFAPAFSLGIRKYIAKESLDNLDNAMRKIFYLRIAHYTTLVFYYAFLAFFYYYVLKFFGLDSYAKNAINIFVPNK